MRPASAASRTSACSFLPALALLLALGGCLREFDNPSDPDARRYTEWSEAFLRRLGDAEPVEGDTVLFVGGVTSGSVAEDSLVARFDWDLDGDGRADTSVAGNDTLAARFEASGLQSVGLTLEDRAGFTSTAITSFRVHPRLSTVFRWSGGADLPAYDTACPFYAQVPELMRAVLAVSHFVQERNREEGFGTADFAYKIAQALTGTAFPLGVLYGFDDSPGPHRHRLPPGGPVRIRLFLPPRHLQVPGSRIHLGSGIPLWPRPGRPCGRRHRPA